MSTPETSRFVRLRVDLVLEVGDEDAVARAALARIADDGDLSAEEQEPARGAVTGDTAEALAHLVDPFGLVGDVPGVELQQASWSSEEIDYDPDSPQWDLDGDGFDGDGFGDDGFDGDGFDGDGTDEASGAGAAGGGPGERDK
ncbi:hypothetical protein ACFU5P_25030 [Streptomyces sp. NPDC057433]|uniref:hypothetical protein n=1 Tax=Streptomyces sp. NPDC057433 TaxID=3346132 RepID=UPI00367BBEC3